MAEGARTPSALEGMHYRIEDLQIDLAEAAERAHFAEALVKTAAALTQRYTGESAVETFSRALVEFFGFGRVMYFDLRDGAAVRRFFIDSGSGGELPPPFLGDDRTFVLGDDDIKIGRPEDLDVPVPDCRNWYVFARVRDEGAHYGFVFADAHPASCCEPLQREVFGLLTSLATATFRATDSHQRATILAHSDPLTGLLNRRAFESRARDALAQCREGGRSCLLAIVDIDDLKAINDGAGHLHGDRVIARTAEALESIARGVDVIARLAGDEFVVLFAECDRDSARVRVRELSRRLRARDLRCSIGGALLEVGDDLQSLLGRADAALYAVKSAGKNGFAVV